jgi:hypothetical protein
MVVASGWSHLAGKRQGGGRPEAGFMIGPVAQANTDRTLAFPDDRLLNLSEPRVHTPEGGAISLRGQHAAPPRLSGG